MAGSPYWLARIGRSLRNGVDWNCAAMAWAGGEDNGGRGGRAEARVGETRATVEPEGQLSTSSSSSSSSSGSKQWFMTMSSAVTIT